MQEFFKEKSKMTENSGVHMANALVSSYVYLPYKYVYMYKYVYKVYSEYYIIFTLSIF